MKLSEILVDPETNKKLVIDWEEGSIEHLGDSFQGQISNRVLSVLPVARQENKQSTEFHNSTNTEFDYIDHYIKDAETFDYFESPDEITANERTRLNQLIVNKIDKAATMILDVGCGNGWLSKAIPLENHQVISLDISPKNVQRVLKENPHPNHYGVVADVFHLPFQDNTFDVIVASEIMEHVYDPKKFINALVKKLKANGKLIITTPYNETIPLSLCVHCNQPTPRHAHLHSFNESNVKQMVSNDVGRLKIEKLTNHHLLKTRLYWLMRFIPFRLWHFIDKAAIKLLGKPTRLILEITK